MHKLVARLELEIGSRRRSVDKRLLGSSLRRPRGRRGRSGRGMGRHDHRLKPAATRPWSSCKTSGLNEPPRQTQVCKMRRRSTVMVEIPHWARSMRRPQNIRKISDCTVPLKP